MYHDQAMDMVPREELDAAVEEARRETRMEFEQQYEARAMDMVPREELDAAVEEARRKAEHKYDELEQQYEDAAGREDNRCAVAWM